MAFEKGCDSMNCFKATLARFDMRKSILITLGLTLLLWIGQAQARPGFVSEDIDSAATRLERNIGDDLGPLATRPLPQLRKDAAQTLSLIHISEPTRRTPISYAVFCL